MGPCQFSNWTQKILVGFTKYIGKKFTKDMIVCIISLKKWEKDDQIPEPKMKISRGLAVFHNCIEVLFQRI